MPAATHKTLGSSDALVKRYSKQAFVYLESEFDVVIYRDKWFFDYLDRVQFRVPPQGAAAHTGCTAVIDAVNSDRAAGVQAFGIVDRDAVMGANLWLLVWNTNDQQFSSARPFGNFVFPTLRWEVENYLVEPAALEEFLVNHEGGRPLRDEADIWADLFQHCNALVPLAACNAVRHHATVPKVGDGFSNGRNRIQTDQLLLSGPISALSEADQARYPVFVHNTDAFAVGPTDRDRVIGLLRRVEGKALISRLRHAHTVHDDPELHFADAIRRFALIPVELRALVESFAAAAI